MVRDIRALTSDLDPVSHVAEETLGPPPTGLTELAGRSSRRACAGEAAKSDCSSAELAEIALRDLALRLGCPEPRAPWWERVQTVVLAGEVILCI